MSRVPRDPPPEGTLVLRQTPGGGCGAPGAALQPRRCCRMAARRDPGHPSQGWPAASQGDWHRRHELPNFFSRFCTFEVCGFPLRRPHLFDWGTLIGARSEEAVKPALQRGGPPGPDVDRGPLRLDRSPAAGPHARHAAAAATPRPPPPAPAARAGARVGAAGGAGHGGRPAARRGPDG